MLLKILFKKLRTIPQRASLFAKSPITESIIPRTRKFLVLSGLAVIYGVLAARAAQLHIYPYSKNLLQNLADRQYHRQIKLSPYRGNIFDRRSQPLALSVKKISFFVNPKTFDPTPEETRLLSKAIGISTPKIRAIARKDRYFAWLIRKTPKEVSDKVLALKIQGIEHISEASRYYPSGIGANVIGKAGIDNNGLFGLEHDLDSYLKGDEIEITSSKDAKGHSLYLQSTLAKPEKSGNNVYLTIDRAVQEIAEAALQKGVKNAQAKSGFAIVSDPYTGKLLAVSSYPSFDPNADSISIERTWNKAFQDLYEPGSIVKPLVLAKALANNPNFLNRTIDCENGVLVEPGFRLRDTHKSGMLTPAEIIVESSNIGAYKIAKTIGPKGVYSSYLAFGLTSEENLVDFTRQTSGRISSPDDWKKEKSRFGNIAIGQGFVTTGIEMVQAYGAIANGGNLLKPILVDRIQSPDNTVLYSQSPKIVRNVMTPDISKKLRHILAEVVASGTASLARMPNYSSAGKTGTSEKVDPKTKRYSDHLRIASFIGFAPAKDPHLVIYVFIDEPNQKPYYGGKWAAPVFAEIAEKSLHYLNVKEDIVEADKNVATESSRSNEKKAF
ncbi:MAG: peptidoglycan D,D-transpeptidase FtsI family protein [Oligoflexales bacterium]